MAFILAAGAGAASLFLYYQYERPGPLDVSRAISIPRGEGRIAIAERLEREGIIANRWTFVLNHLVQNALESGEAGELKAGEYEFKKSTSMREVLRTLIDGKSILAKLTIPEGLTSQQIVERLRAEPSLSGEITAVPPEGSLLADTYAFSKGRDRQELLDLMRTEQQRLLTRVWERRQADIPLAAPEEALILASVIEKETGRADERERVAAVFVNRLRKGMRLQSDPTIIYGIVAGQGPLGRPITRGDIEQKTPYNTYHIPRLPPTPICNPGRAAIEAALNPAKTGDLYFVANGDGGHAFSATLKDHNAAVADWRKIEREMRAKQEAAAPASPVTEVKDQNRALPVAGSQAVAANGDDGPEPDGASAEAAAPETAPSKAPAAGPAKSAAAVSVPLPVRKPKR